MKEAYKIETYSDGCAREVAQHISHKGGVCVVQGWAVITDYCFNTLQSLELLPFISGINDNVSENDIYQFMNQHQVMA